VARRLTWLGDQAGAARAVQVKLPISGSGGDNAGVDAIGQAVHDVLGDLVADMADEQGTAKPAIGSPNQKPSDTAIRPTRASAKDRASSQECRASATSVAELMRLPTMSLYRATAWFPTMPSAAPVMPRATWLVVPWSTSLRMLSYPANAALAQMTMAIPIPARFSARSRP
jgi:hypothetical protein